MSYPCLALLLRPTPPAPFLQLPPPPPPPHPCQSDRRLRHRSISLPPLATWLPVAPLTQVARASARPKPSSITYWDNNPRNWNALAGRRELRRRESSSRRSCLSAGR